MTATLETEARFEHEPQNFLVHAFDAIDQEIERRHPGATERERLRKEPLLNFGLLFLIGPYILAYRIEKTGVEIAQMGNEILKAPTNHLVNIWRRNQSEAPTPSTPQE